MVLLATFLLTVFRDLAEGILVGFALGAVLFINRMAEATGIEAGIPLAAGDRADDANGERRPYDASLATDPDVMVYRITGAFFFGAAAAIGTALDSISDRHKAFVIDFAAVPLLDFDRREHDPSHGGGSAAARRPAVHHRGISRGAPGPARSTACGRRSRAFATASIVPSPTSRPACRNRSMSNRRCLDGGDRRRSRPGRRLEQLPLGERGKGSRRAAELRIASGLHDLAIDQHDDAIRLTQGA